MVLFYFFKFDKVLNGFACIAVCERNSDNFITDLLSNGNYVIDFAVPYSGSMFVFYKNEIDFYFNVNFSVQFWTCSYYEQINSCWESAFDLINLVNIYISPFL